MLASLISYTTPIAGVARLERVRRGDTRGYFERIFCAETLLACDWHEPIAQINHSYTEHVGVVRGMHYQRPPHADAKLVSCVRGEVWDVVLDLRCGSPTFLHWHGVKLSAENGRALLIPKGCAHGFQTLSNDAELLYCHTAAYTPESDAGVSAIDGRFKIEWPLPISIMSDKDRAYPPIADNFQGVSL